MRCSNLSHLVISNDLYIFDQTSVWTCEKGTSFSFGIRRFPDALFICPSESVMRFWKDLGSESGYQLEVLGIVVDNGLGTKIIFRLLKLSCSFEQDSP